MKIKDAIALVGKWTSWLGIRGLLWTFFVVYSTFMYAYVILKWEDIPWTNPHDFVEFWGALFGLPGFILVAQGYLQQAAALRLQSQEIAAAAHDQRQASVITRLRLDGEIAQWEADFERHQVVFNPDFKLSLSVNIDGGIDTTRRFVYTLSNHGKTVTEVYIMIDGVIINERPIMDVSTTVNIPLIYQPHEEIEPKYVSIYYRNGRPAHGRATFFIAVRQDLPQSTYKYPSNARRLT